SPLAGFALGHNRSPCDGCVGKRRLSASVWEKRNPAPRHRFFGIAPLKPKYVLPPPVEAQSNYITDIGAKWYRNYFYFFSIYACPGPNALSPTFESKFARMERLGDGKFALYFKRHTGEWVGIYDSLSVDECMKAIQDDPWFVP